MATTTNFGWETPDDTDLVKDGALAMRTLGNAIDASLVDLKGGTTGQVLSKTSNTDMDFTWVTSDDANAIQNAIVDAKGDLITATANDTPARLAVGNNGETLVADSSASTGLRWQGSLAGGRNCLINGGFDFSQRGTGAIAPGGYNLDRWYLDTFGTAANGLTAQLKTDAAQTGFTNYVRIAAGSSSVTNINFSQSLETAEVRKLQGKTVVVSFRYKLPVNFTNVWSVAAYYSTNIDQNISNFGASGAVNIGSKNLTNTSSWTFDSWSFTVPTNATSLSIQFGNGANAVSTAQFDLAQVQLEVGSVPTQFSRAGGTLAGELAACQRYYWRQSATTITTQYGQGSASTTTTGAIQLKAPVTMRRSPTAIDYSNVMLTDGAFNYTISALVILDDAPDITYIRVDSTGLTQYRPLFLRANATTSSYVGLTAEL